MSSFDIVSEADVHEVENAFNQALREIKQRYDFQGTGALVEKNDKGFSLLANSEEKVKAVQAVLIDKFVKRKISLKFLDSKEAQPAGGQNWRMSIDLKKGIDKENAKKIVKIIKEDKKLKVTPAIQDDLIRVTGKKLDDLQAVMGMLKEKKDIPLALDFTNFRN